MNFEIKKLQSEHKNELLVLSDIIVGNLKNKLTYIPFNKEEIKNMFDDDYAIYVGAFVNKKLVATSAIYFSQNYTKFVKEHVSVNGKFAEIGHCMVLSEFRGNNLMLKLNKELLEIAKTKAVDYACFTVHPENVASFTSMTTLGAKKESTYIRDKIYQRHIYVLKIN